MFLMIDTAGMIIVINIVAVAYIASRLSAMSGMNIAVIFERALPL